MVGGVVAHVVHDGRHVEHASRPPRHNRDAEVVGVGIESKSEGSTAVEWVIRSARRETRRVHVEGDQGDQIDDPHGDARED